MCRREQIVVVGKELSASRLCVSTSHDDPDSAYVMVPNSECIIAKSGTAGSGRYCTWGKQYGTEGNYAGSRYCTYMVQMVTMRAVPEQSMLTYGQIYKYTTYCAKRHWNHISNNRFSPR